MPISFNQVPSANRVPFVFVEFDNSNAIQGAQVLPYRALLIGQKLVAGSAVADTPVRVTSLAQAKTLFGDGSVLAGMFAAWFDQNDFTEVWALPVADNGAGVAATGTVAVTGPATAAGTINLMIAGRVVQVAVANGDAATAVATAIAAAVNADATLPVTANAASSTVTLTARNKGETGNDIDIRHSYYSGETLPAGIALVITAMASGATNPVLTTAIGNLGDEWFQVMACAFRDTASLTALKTELDDRWGPVRQIEGHLFVGATGSVGSLASLGNAHNSKHLTIVPTQYSPTPAYEIAAETSAVVAYYAPIDPARPFQTLPYSWLKAPTVSDRFTQSERNTLLYDGVSTYRVDTDGTCRVERLITTYKTNAAGGDDPSYLDVVTLLTLGYIRWDFRNHVLRKYPRHKLADDGTRFGAGQAIVTPKVMKAECVAKFADWEAIGLVEGREQFKRDLIVERNLQDRNRLDILMPPDLVNQLRVVGTQISFIL